MSDFKAKILPNLISFRAGLLLRQGGEELGNGRGKGKGTDERIGEGKEGRGREEGRRREGAPIEMKAP